MAELKQPARILPIASHQIERTMRDDIGWGAWKNPRQVLISERKDGSQIGIATDATLGNRC